MKRESRKPVSARRDGFWFIANQVALDFLNTRPVEHGQAAELLPDFAALLRWFQAAGLLSADQASKLQWRWRESARARRTWEELLALRERLRQEVLAWEAGGAVRPAVLEELNRALAEHPVLARLKTTRNGLVRELWFAIEEPEDLLGPLAHAAAALFAGVRREHVRKCAECALQFHDTSRKGTRRWCSMQLCGNRAKVAAYAARQRRL